jgi:hypothetical protein
MEGGAMTAAANRVSERTLSFSLDVEEISKYARITALVSAVLAASGILSVVSYLSAWRVPAPLIRLDPLTATLRSETVIAQVLMLALIVFGLDAVVRRLAGRRFLRVAAGVVMTLLIVYSIVLVFVGGYVSGAITMAGGGALFLAHARDWISPRITALLFTLIAIVSASQTGVESGRLIRDHEVYQTPITLTSRTPIGGLDGGIEQGGAWHYEGLYLVFRDGEAVYVSRPGAGPAVWIVPSQHVMALGLAGEG